METSAPHPRNITQWSIDHPYAVIAFYFAVAVLSVIAIGFYMPRRMMPYVESPLIGIVSMMPGLSAEEMELYISKPIEEQMTNVQGVRYIRSTSQEGFSIVVLEFNYGANMRKALVDVQALMNVAQANLPMTGANLKPSWVLAIDPLNIPVLTLSLKGDGWDPVRLREFADNEAINRLKALPGVYSIAPFGGYRRQLQVIVDRDKAASYGLSILDVRDAIDRRNISKPGGTLTRGDWESIARVDTRARDARTVLDYPVASVPANGTGAQRYQSPRIVYVRDLARVVDTHWERRSAYHFVHSGKIEPSIEVAVIQDPDASSPQVIARVKKELKSLEHEHPGVRFNVSYDNSHFVGILFRNMFEELLLAVVLTGIAVLFFLGEWRGTLISMTTIPISLAMAVLAMIPFGMTLNSSTLIGLLLAIGRLVDDSIIDIHSVERHLRMGKDPKTTAVDGITEVRLAVLSSTLVICLALSPLLFCGGIVQLMFVGLIWPIIFGLLASMLVSFTLTALMAAHLLRPHEEIEAERRHWFYRAILDPFQRLLNRMEQGYGRLIQWMLKHRFTNMTRILATIVIGFGFYYFITSEMMPLADVGQAYGVLETQPGLSFAKTEQIVAEFERILLGHPEIEKVSSEIGTETAFESTGVYYTGYAMPSINAATFMITLSDKEERKRSIWNVIDSARDEALKTIPGIRRLQIKEMGSDVMATSAAPIQLLITGKDLNILSKLGEQVAGVARKVPGVYQVATSWTMGVPDYEVVVDQKRAGELGLAPAEIAEQAYYAMRGGLTTEFWRLPNIRQNTILVRYEKGQRGTPEDLEQIYIKAPDGRQAPLKSVADVKLRAAPTLIEHDGLRRVTSVLAYYRPKGPGSMDLSMEIVNRAMTEVNFPPGYGIEMRGDMTQMMDSFRRLFRGLMFAIIFIFLILVAQFRGFLQPLQMIFSVPLELSGVFFLLWLNHQAFSTVSIMAVIVLTGMDITTAILLIDLIMRYRARGIPRDQAVMEACPQRLRPILMTSIITIIVLAPVAFFPKTGIDAYSPLGTVVIGGLIVGTILSLLDIPIMHTYVDDLARWVRRKLIADG